MHNEQLSEQKHQRLLRDLNSENADQRLRAVERVQREKITDESIITVLKIIAANDTREIVRKTAGSTLVHLGFISAIGDELPPIRDSSEEVRKQRARLQSAGSLIFDFMIGFLGWWIINGLFWLGVIGNQDDHLTEKALLILLLIAVFYLAELITLIVFAVRRGLIALGMIFALASNLAITLFMGLTENAYSFVPFFITLHAIAF